MGDLINKLVTFTEPLMIGAFAIIVVLFVIFRTEKYQRDIKLEIGILLTQFKYITFGIFFVIISAVGTISDEFSYWFVELTPLHENIISDLDLDLKITPTKLCENIENIENKGSTENRRILVRDLSAIFSELPISEKLNNKENPLISRANYSTRLIRGVVLWSFIGLILAILIGLNNSWNCVSYQFWILGFVLFMSIFSWRGAELSYHRAANYDAVQYLLVGYKSESLCRKIKLMSIEPEIRVKTKTEVKTVTETRALDNIKIENKIKNTVEKK